MMSKLDIREIFCDHFSTLKDYSTKKPKKTDFIIFLGIPIIVAPGLIWWHGTLPITLIVVIGTSLSVFASLLLNLFILTYNTVLKSKIPESSQKERSLQKELALEINSNIAFAIVIALTIVVLVLYFGIAHDSISKPFVILLTFLIYFLGVLFGLKILMLLKRIYILLKGELFHLNS